MEEVLQAGYRDEMQDLVNPGEMPFNAQNLELAIDIVQKLGGNPLCQCIE
jgi:hypothetical protein